MCTPQLSAPRFASLSSDIGPNEESRSIDPTMRRLLAMAPLVARQSPPSASLSPVPAAPPPPAADLSSNDQASDLSVVDGLRRRTNLISESARADGIDREMTTAGLVQNTTGVDDRPATDVAALQENLTKSPLAITDTNPDGENGYTKIAQDWGTPRGIVDPLTHLPVRNAKDEILLWPSGINPIEVYNSGANSKSSEALSAGPILFSQNGYWDFQRGGSQDGKINHPEFVDASTVVIGLYNAAAGVPLNVTLAEQNNYARFRSHYKSGTPMDKVYTYLPVRNVMNTVIGYRLATSIRRARAN